MGGCLTGVVGVVVRGGGGGCSGNLNGGPLREQKGLFGARLWYVNQRLNYIVIILTLQKPCRLVEMKGIIAKKKNQSFGVQLKAK